MALLASWLEVPIAVGAGWASEIVELNPAPSACHKGELPVGANRIIADRGTRSGAASISVARHLRSRVRFAGACRSGALLIARWVPVV